MNLSVSFFPWLDGVWYLLLALLAAVLVILAVRRRVRSLLWRAAALGLLALLLSHPVILRENRVPLPDKMIIVVDKSASQKIGGRDIVAEKTVAALRDMAAEPIVVEVAGSESTNLFSPLRDALLNVPVRQSAGVVLVTDGQVHDAPADMSGLGDIGPVNIVLTGKRDEFDRRLSLVSAPKYGVLGQDVRISVKVEQNGKGPDDLITLSAWQDGKLHSEVPVNAGDVRAFDFSLDHPGQNVFEFTINAVDGELTAANNAMPVIVSSVRDRTRVLLVSGSPHMGERSWRNLLKSDPSIDLVHFTILRPPSAIDMTPQNELALIVFPVDELFNKKIRDFDLIILDRYLQYNLLLPEYFANMADFVREGGALLVAFGTEQNDSFIQSTALADIMPVRTAANQEIARGAYRPQRTPEGQRHPVTAELRGNGNQSWGEWFAQMEAQKSGGETLLSGLDGRPLLVLDKAGEGRVAVLSSDNVWLWSKGGETAGPYNELLRNLAHWLMKEPALESDFIKAEARGNVIAVAQRHAGESMVSVPMRTPSGEAREIDLLPAGQGWARAEMMAEESGIYSFGEGARKAFVIVGAARNQEFSEVMTTDRVLSSLAKQTGGRVIWAGEGAAPDVALRRNRAYDVASVAASDLLPPWLAVLLVTGGLFLVFRRESR